MSAAEGQAYTPFPERRRVRADGFVLYAHLPMEVEEGDLGWALGTAYAGGMTVVVWDKLQDRKLMTTTDMVDFVAGGS